MSFRILSEEEFQRLGTKERIEYLRQAIAALDELRGQMHDLLMRDMGARVQRIPYPPDSD